MSTLARPKPKTRGEAMAWYAGRAVKVHWNRHRACWSVRPPAGGTFHLAAFALEGVAFRVLRKGRARALLEGQRNVHAYVTGRLVEPADYPPPPRQAYYNPFKTETFVDADDWAEVGAASLVVGDATGRLFYSL